MGWPPTNTPGAGPTRPPLMVPRAGVWRARVDSWRVALKGFLHSHLPDVRLGDGSAARTWARRPR
jgi:hypothetical protein